MSAPAKKQRKQPERADLLARPKRGDMVDLEDWLDKVDVPATVVCARCGSSECTGCSAAVGEKSGFIAVIPWERSDASVMRRLWQTARATTRDPERFFEALPEGPIAPAFRFAALAELVASAAMIFAVLAATTCIAPSMIARFVLDASARGIAARMLLASIPTLAALLVAAHVAHGVALDFGAPPALRSRARRLHALRFGLYATGWDVVLGPVGALLVLLQEGTKGFRALTEVAQALPGKSARAFLRGAYGLSGEAAKRPMRASFWASAMSIGFAVILTVGVIAAALLG